MKPPISVSDWPMDGTQWIARTAEALKAAGVDAEAVARLTARLSGVRDFSLVVEGCLVVLARHYTVTGGPA